MENLKRFFKNNWLVLLIAAQPVLDALAFWTQDSVATAAGYLRLLVMLALPLYLLFTLEKKKTFIASMAVIAGFGVLHMLNGFRLGYINLFYDLAYYARVIQTPVFAVCFIYLIRDENSKKQAIRGIEWAAIILLFTVAAALATGTWNSTYGAGVGLSGWVTDDNRCANSIIMVTFAVFAVGLSAVTENKAAQALVPAAVTAVLIANGTKACYTAVFAILLGYALFMVIRRIMKLDRLKPVFLVSALTMTVVSVLVYPVSPRAKIDGSLGQAKSETQLKFENLLEENGYDIYSMSFEEKMADPKLKELFFDYYQSLLGVMPDIYDRFGMDRVYEKYDMTVSADKLIDMRLLKVNYASMIFEDSDFLTKLLGFEATETVKNGMYDMENDYHAVFYYYGYLGFGLYIAFLLFFAFLIIKRLVRDFKGSLSMENFMLLLCLMLQLGLAQFSGSLLRRPNVSIYLSIILALIYYKTEVFPISGKKESVQ